jgi:hypothetical protein
LLGVALVALAFGVSVGLAKSGPRQVKVNLYSPDNLQFCPVKTDKHVAGTATVIREKGVITARVHLHGAVPGKYIIELGVPNPLSPSGCNVYGPFGMTKQTFSVGAFNQDTGTPYVSPLFKLGSS